MLLAIDVGNTSTHFGIFQERKLLSEWRVPTSALNQGADIKKKISENQKITNTVVSSVVPKVNKTIKKLFPKAIFVNHRNVGIKVKVKKPSEVGTDRLINALAAFKIYGGPAIVVDFGTATTFDVISAKGEYLGGAIAPGLIMARDALHEKTAKLPKIKIRNLQRVIGKTTREAISSGLIFGYAAMVEGIIKKIKNQNAKIKNAKIIATGGLAKIVCKYTKVIDKIDAYLTLKGLKIMSDNLKVTKPGKSNV